LAQVDYDLVTAENMLNTGRFLYVVFMCHLALEKALKALVTEETGKTPPKSHNLIALAQRARLDLPEDRRDFIGQMNDASIVTRYPEDLPNIVAQYSQSVAGVYLQKTKELIAWIRRDPRLNRP
jgi:HEPN domain-containing protein